MIKLTVDGQMVTLENGGTVLDAVRAAGIPLPTLCHHEGLQPYGACRLCLVALTGDQDRLVAACIHPAEEGLQVRTDAPQAVQARRLTLEFLLARCPQSDVIRNMAAQVGITASRFETTPAESNPELCILCGLCVRVCREAIGACAIEFVGRGEARTVSTPFQLNTDACVGCGSCAAVCPTGAIRIEDRNGLRILHTWNTQVELRACPDCGRSFMPQPLEFLKERFPEIRPFWNLCPACRSKRTARMEMAAGLS